MMSQDLGAVSTTRHNPCQSALLAVALLFGFGFGVAPAGAQQAGPQPPQAEAVPTPAAHPARAQAPQVTFDKGQLTIVAENATLSDVLNALRNTMGTEVEVPAGSSSERVWAHLGPGSAHKVLSDLFANTDLDYIIQGSPSDPGKIRSVTLSVRGQDSGRSGPAGEESASAPRRGRFALPTQAPEPERVESEPVPAPAAAPATQEASATPAAPAPTDQPASAGDSSSTAASQTPAAPQPTAPNPLQVNMEPTGPSNVYPQTPQPSAGTFNPHPNPPPNMSTDQMVQQLTNMYQQRRQMQTGQASSTPN